MPAPESLTPWVQKNYDATCFEEEFLAYHFAPSSWDLAYRCIKNGPGVDTILGIRLYKNIKRAQQMIKDMSAMGYKIVKTGDELYGKQ